MFKEIKILIYLVVILAFFFFSIKHYISDDYKKNYYRGLSTIDVKNDNFAKSLPILESDTENIIKYSKINNKNKKKYQFWKLLQND